MTKQHKQAVVEELIHRLTTTKGAVVTEYRGTSVANMDKVRSKLHDANIVYAVAKNSLLKRAIASAGKNPPEGDILDRPIALAFGDDEAAVAKHITEISKQVETIVPVAGFFDGRFVGAAVVARLASLPNRHELMAQLAGGLAGLPQKMVRTINNPLTGLVTALRAIEKQKEA